MNRAHLHRPAHLGAAISDRVTAFVGSWWAILLHATWFALWIGAGIEAFPFGLLTMIVSLEAIFMTTLLLIADNRQSRIDRARDEIVAAEVAEILALLRQLVDERTAC